MPNRVLDMSRIDRSRAFYGEIALLVLLLLAFFGGAIEHLFEAGALLRPDEGRYAEIARAMVWSGDWITPRLNGLKYFEKPPLQYWATAVAFKLFGVSTVAARWWPVFTAIASLCMMGFTAWRLRSMMVAIAVCTVLGSSLLFVIFGMSLTLDMSLSFCICMILCSFALALTGRQSRQSSRWMLLAWVAMAAAVLSKGLIGIVLPALTAMAYLLSTGHWWVLKRLRPLVGSALFLALTLPWFVFVQSRNPEFFQFFFIHEHLERYLRPDHHRPGAWWYFLAVGAIGLLPWTIAGGAVLIEGLRTLWRSVIAGSSRMVRVAAWFRTDPTEEFDLDSWFACSAIVTVAFFSMSSSKLPGYIVPAFPALAWLIGQRLLTASRRLMLVIHAGNALLAGGLLAGMPWLIGLLAKRYDPGLLATVSDGFRLACLFLIVGMVVAAIATARNLRLPAVVAMGIAGLMAWNHGLLSARQLSPLLSSERIVRYAQGVEADALKQVPFYSVEVFDSTLSYYLERPVTMVNVTDELAMGLRSEPARGMTSIAQWRSVWQSGSQAYAYLRQQTFEHLLAEGLPARLVAVEAGRVIIARH